MALSQKIKLQIASGQLHARWLPSLDELTPSDQGFARGYSDGLEKAQADCKREMEERIAASRARWEAVASSLNSIPQEMIQKLREQLVSLAFSVVGKILAATPLTREEIAGQVSQMLEHAEGGAEVEIQLNPEDLALLNAEDRGALWSENLTHLKWTSNPSIQRGGAVIHSELGWMDGRRAARLNKLEQLAQNAIREES